MASLFVIGNGFDIAHGIKSNYSDFRGYLIKTHQGVKVGDDYVPPVPEPTLLSEYYDENEVVEYIIYVINRHTTEEWSELESCLGEKIFPTLRSEMREIYIDEEEKEIHQAVCYNQDTSRSLRNVILKLKEFFYKWVNTTLSNLSDIKSDSEKNNILKKGKSYYLNFNYTNTLEKVYDIPDSRICHIHGKCGDPIEKNYFGHSNIIEPQEDPVYWGCEDDFFKLKELLRKDVEFALYSNQSFFDKLKGVDKIYPYGFSFSETDDIYTEKLISLFPDAQWYFNKYDYEEKNEVIKKMRQRVHISEDKPVW